MKFTQKLRISIFIKKVCRHSGLVHEKGLCQIDAKQYFCLISGLETLFDELLDFFL